MGHPHRRNSLTERMRTRYRLDPGTTLGEEDSMCRAPDIMEEGEGEVKKAEVDIYKVIQEKEHDLVLAAELGKVLLDKNEEISQIREKIVLDYTQRLEALSQEKYLMSRQLERLEDEYQQEVAELQTEIEKLRRNVDKQRRRRGAWEREMGDKVDNLTMENMRLAGEVRRRTEHERRMQDNKEDVNTELSVRQVNVQEHCDKIEELNKNVLEINLAKDALEAQIETLNSTVQGLNSSVNSTQARERALERKIQLQDHSMHELERDCEKMRSYNLQVLSRLEKVSVSLLPPGSEQTGNTNLMQEIESFDSPYQKQEVQERFEKEQMADAEILAETDIGLNDEKDEIEELREEVLSVYEQIRNLVVNLKRSKPNSVSVSHRGQSLSGASLHTSIASSESSDHSAVQFQVSQLNSLLHELDCLISRKVSDQCVGDGEEESNCQKTKLEFEVELHQTKLAVEQTETRLVQVAAEAKQKQDQLQELKCKLALMTVNLSAVMEERDMYAADILDTSSRDIVIKNACDKRDEAVENKNAAEVELASQRIELMQVNSQLLDTVQHKARLGEQLDEMEVNIVSQIQDQVRHKLDTAAGEGGSSSESSDSDGSGREKLTRKLSRMIFGK